MRILVSAGWLGGAGGAERSVHAVCTALGEQRCPSRRRHAGRSRLELARSEMPDRRSALMSRTTTHADTAAHGGGTCACPKPAPSGLRRSADRARPPAGGRCRHQPPRTMDNIETAPPSARASQCSPSRTIWDFTTKPPIPTNASPPAHHYRWPGRRPSNLQMSSSADCRGLRHAWWIPMAPGPSSSQPSDQRVEPNNRT